MTLGYFFGFELDYFMMIFLLSIAKVDSKYLDKTCLILWVDLKSTYAIFLF